jgi:hypothetical protein
MDMAVQNWQARQDYVTAGNTQLALYALSEFDDAVKRLVKHGALSSAQSAALLAASAHIEAILGG